MQGLVAPGAARRRRRADDDEGAADDAGTSEADATGLDDESEGGEGGDCGTGPDGIGYESSGLASDESELEFRGCESESEAEAAAEGGSSSASELSSDEESDDPELLCFECEGEMEEQRDTEHEGQCDCCKRKVPPEEVTLTCKGDCDFDICLPCAALRLSEQPSASPAQQHLAASSVPAGPIQPAATAGAGSAVGDSTATAPAPSAWQRQVAAIGERIRARARGLEPRRSREVEFVEWLEQRANAAGGTSATSGAAAMVRAEDANSASASGTPTTGYALTLPDTVTVWPEERVRMAEQVRTVVAAGGPALQLALSFAREVFRQVPSAALASVADDVYGPVSADALSDSEGRVVEDLRPPEQFLVDLPNSRPLLACVTSQHRCFCCDDELGGRSRFEVCTALQMYDTLQEDLRSRDAIIASEIAAGADVGAVRRAARKFMYRTFVATQYGYLGHGVRIRIPDCVIAAIRWRFPNPGCDCALACIATCEAHGYMGHRDS